MCRRKSCRQRNDVHGGPNSLQESSAAAPLRVNSEAEPSHHVGFRVSSQGMKLLLLHFNAYNIIYMMQ
jgi:hypothetical protein